MFLLYSFQIVACKWSLFLLALVLEPTNMLDLNAIIWLENYLQVSLYSDWMETFAFSVIVNARHPSKGFFGEGLYREGAK